MPPTFKRPSPPVPPPSQQSRSKVSFSTVAEAKGQRAVLYGTGGIGKSTLACQLPDVAFVDIDESLPVLKNQLKAAGIAIPKVVGATSWQQVRTALQSDGWDGIKNVVLDTGTKLEEMAVEHTLKFTKKEGGKAATDIEDYGFGKGYQHVFDTFLPILGDLDRHVRAGRNVIIICHDCTNNVPNPNGEDWLRYEPRLQSPKSGKASIRLRLKEWADHVLFLTYDINSEDGKAQGSGTRTLHTAELPAFMAKSRTTTESFSIVHGESPWDKILK